MIIVNATSAVPFENSRVCSGVSYVGTGEHIDGAVITVSGRYPQSGFLINEISKELVYITAGQGQLISSGRKEDFTKGDVIFIDNGEEFAWDGDFEGFFATTPTFDPSQHKEVA